MRKISVLILSLVFAFLSNAQSIVGKWKTIDDETGKVKSIVKLYIKNNKLYGDILKIYPEPGDPKDPVCDKCSGSKKGKKIIGMEIISGLEKDGEEWKKDDGILDPKKGKIYDCKIWLEDKDKLGVRGYIGFFFRTQYWIRAK